MDRAVENTEKTNQRQEARVRRRNTHLCEDTINSIADFGCMATTALAANYTLIFFGMRPCLPLPCECRLGDRRRSHLCSSAVVRCLPDYPPSLWKCVPLLALLLVASCDKLSFLPCAWSCGASKHVKEVKREIEGLRQQFSLAFDVLRDDFLVANAASMHALKVRML